MCFSSVLQCLTSLHQTCFSHTMALYSREPMSPKVELHDPCMHIHIINRLFRIRILKYSRVLRV